MISDDDDCYCFREKMIGDDWKKEVKDDKNGVFECFYFFNYLYGLLLDIWLSLNRILKEGKIVILMLKENVVMVVFYLFNNGFSYKEIL